jgi:hypothetical protein
MSVPKKSKTYHFHNELEIEYMFVKVKDNCCCLICNASVSLQEKGNLERHTCNNAFHCNKYEYDADLPPKSEIPKLKLRELKSKLGAQQQLMAKPRSLSNNATI